MSTKKKLLEAAAGNAGGGPVYVDDVFSTYLYTGTGGNRNIENGIDLAGKGGLVWIKDRTYNIAHYLTDTERGATKVIYSNSSSAEETKSESLMSFNSNGFSLGTNTSVNGSLNEVASWTFRKAPGFFDVVTYTGDGTNGRQIPHNLGSVPGMIIIKRTSLSSAWYCWHRNYTGAGLYLNFTSVYSGDTPAFNTSQSSTTFNLSTTSNNINVSGYTYVAYIFAHDAQEFGTDEDESIIKCGTYTGNGSTTGPIIDLGWEPQWLMIKRSSDTSGWYIMDNMRGLPVDGPANNTATPSLQAQESTSEGTSTNSDVDINPTGFQCTTDANGSNANGSTYIYMAIRRPHKPAEEFAATDLFAMDVTGAGEFPMAVSGFPVDMGWLKKPDVSYDNFLSSRLIQRAYLKTNSTAAQSSNSSFTFDYQDGFSENWDVGAQAWMFRRAPGFFDVVAYKGLNTNGAAIAHNLGVAPELVVIKARTTTYDWMVSVPTGTPDGREQSVSFNLDSASRNERMFPSGGQLPDANNVYLAAENRVNTSVHTYVMYLFASVPGISKVGSYTGTGNNLNVDCGFSAGARFILIKRTDSTGDWYYWDSLRGIIAGNDPYLLLNTTAGQVTTTDYIDPLASGFTVTSSAPAALNASGGTYIFLAIA